MPVGVGVGVRVPLAARVGSGFSPASIPGLALWLDASQLTGLSDGDPVQTWPDLSGNGRDATQATLAMRPTYKVGIANGLPGLWWDGSDDLLLTPDISSHFPAAATAFIVYHDSGSATGVNLLTTDDNDQWWRHPASTNSYPSTFRASRIDAYESNVPFGDTEVISIVSDAARWQEWRNSVSLGIATPAFSPGTIGYLSIAGSPLASDGPKHLLGYTHEVLLYGRSLSDDERLSVESYLRAKWGTP